jgi:hypothetical protein
MERVEHYGNCQRPGCTCRGESRYRIEGDAFEADAERGVEAGYRLFCKVCALAIERAVHPYLQLGSPATAAWTASRRAG